MSPLRKARGHPWLSSVATGPMKAVGIAVECSAGGENYPLIEEECVDRHLAVSRGHLNVSVLHIVVTVFSLVLQSHIPTFIGSEAATEGIELCARRESPACYACSSRRPKLQKVISD